MAKRLIEVFMVNEALNNQSSHSGCCCNSGCCCGSAKSLSIDELAESFSIRYGSANEFQIYYLTKDNKQEFISMLNKVFKESGERLVVSEANINFVLSKVSPLIVVDGKVISVKNYPDEEQLYNAIISGKRIPTKPRCC
ncbi:hypothetical protein [Vallitalea okinawensis]|uniref:hypothetical protein n=1 Tax=Vallitalea okinawensis TaxID=2078660 RepID=UPI000CFAB10C|nr:hypothetical protein [Vallitalea okinawensis]